MIIRVLVSGPIPSLGDLTINMTAVIELQMEV